MFLGDLEMVFDAFVDYFQPDWDKLDRASGWGYNTTLAACRKRTKC